MSDEISQVVEMEYKGIYYLFKGSYNTIATLIKAIKAVSEWHHKKYLNKPGSCTWQKIQETSEGTAPVLEIPKEMLEKTIKNPNLLGESYISPFELYCTQNGLRYCMMPDLNPFDDYIPVGVPSQDLSIHHEQMKAWMSRRKDAEESKNEEYEKKIQEKNEEIANARSEEEKEKLEGELTELIEARNQNQNLLEETKEKMSHDNTISFEEYLLQGKGTNFEKDPEKALAMEEECGIIREFMPEDCMVPIRDENLVPDSKELYYSQQTADDELFTIKRAFEKDDQNMVYSVYSVTDSKDPSKVYSYSDRGLSREAWMKKLPEMLQHAGMVADQMTTAHRSQDRLSAYIRGIDGNFSKAPKEGAGEKTKEFSSEEAKEYVEKGIKDKKQEDAYEESLYTTITVPSSMVMTDGEGKMSLELAGGLVSGAPVTSASKRNATLEIKSDDIFEVKSPDGEKTKITGADIIAELTNPKAKEEAKAVHHSARR